MSTAEVVLVPMGAEEFTAYIEQVIPEYAQDKVESGQWSAASALTLSRQDYDELLPEGLATPGHVLLTLQDAATRAKVGVLWYAIEERAGRRIAYVYDILVETTQRRMGYASRALEALEAEVGSRGLGGIALHVFGHNKTAQRLYAKLGYEATNINMFKTVAMPRDIEQKSCSSRTDSFSAHDCRMETSACCDILKPVEPRQ